MASAPDDAAFLATLELFLPTERTRDGLLVKYFEAADRADRDVHSGVRIACQRFSSVAVITEPNIDSSCVYVLNWPSGRIMTLFLSTFLPYAAVVVPAGDHGRLLDDNQVHDECPDLLDALDSAGLKLLSPLTCRLVTRFLDPVDLTPRTVFEVLFEHDVDPPWEWTFPADTTAP